MTEDEIKDYIKKARDFIDYLDGTQLASLLEDELKD
jgi:hypothetical protein